MYVVRSHQNQLIEHKQNTIFMIKKKISLDYPKSAAMGFVFLRTQEQVRSSHGKRAISVRATEVPLYRIYIFVFDVAD